MNNYPLAVLFDLDDTLISFEGVSGQAWDACVGAFIAQHSYQFTKEDLLLKLNEVRRWYWSDPTRHKIGRENLKNARREVVQLTLFAFSITDTALTNTLADAYTEYQDALVCLFPNTIATLTELKTRGVRMGLVTNGSSHSQRAKLARFGLTDFFEIILIDQEVGYGKPDPRIYKHALALLALLPADVWMVGDNLVWDVQAPQELGIHAIWNDYKKAGLPSDSMIHPDRIICDVMELL